MTFVRGANDPYTASPQSERAAVVTLYEHARPGDSIGAFTGNLPWNDQGVGAFHYLIADPNENESKGFAVAYFVRMHPRWLILTATERNWGVVVRNWEPNWLSNAMTKLLASGYHVFRSWPDAVILESDTSSGGSQS